MANFRFGFRLWKGGPWLSTVLFGRGRSRAISDSAQSDYL